MNELIDKSDIDIPTPEEYAEQRIDHLRAVLDSPRARHAIAEGYEEVPLW